MPATEPACKGKRELLRLRMRTAAVATAHPEWLWEAGSHPLLYIHEAADPKLIHSFGKSASSGQESQVPCERLQCRRLADPARNYVKAKTATTQALLTRAKQPPQPSCLPCTPEAAARPRASFNFCVMF